MTHTPPSASATHLDEERAAEIRKAAEARYVEIYAPQRSWPFLAAMGAFCACLWALSLVSAVEHVFRVTPPQMALAMGVQFAFIANATVAARFFGGALGRAHRIAEGLESISCAVVAASLLYASGNAVSVFWMMTALHLMNNAQEVLGARTTRIAHTVSLGVVALAFAFSGKTADALVVAFFGALLVLLARTQEAAARRLLGAEVERNVLRRKLDEAIAERERARIARDLHDGFGARLAAIAWTADAIAAGDATPEDLRDLSERARMGLADLRHVVRGMTTTEASVEHFARALEADCRALVPRDCAFVVTTEGDGMLSGDLCVQLGFFVRESIRNAVQHAKPSAIGLDFVVGDSFEVRVANDGLAPPEGAFEQSRGGLSHLATRAAEAHAELTFGHDEGRTRVVWRMRANAAIRGSKLA